MKIVRTPPLLSLLILILLVSCIKKEASPLPVVSSQPLYSVELLSFEQACTISGIIYDDEGQPISKATVSILKYLKDSRGDTIVSTETDRNGSYSMSLNKDQLQSGHIVMFSTEAVGYGKRNIILHLFMGRYRINAVIGQHRGMM